MSTKRYKLGSDEGFTLIEAILTIVIMSIMMLGLSIVIMAFRDHLDRSWAVRTMDQYGNDVIEELTHELRNAIDVSIRVDTRYTDRITVTRLDDFDPRIHRNTLWYADLRTGQIKRDHIPLDLLFPPRNLRRSEWFEIRQFMLNPYGSNEPRDARLFDPDEMLDAQQRNKAFKDATYNVEFTLRYNRGTIRPGDRPWYLQKSYQNRVYIRNMNLVVKSGVTG